MMYLPDKEGQPELTKLFVEMFGLLMPERVAEAVVKRDVKMIFGLVTKDLIKVIMPFEFKLEIMALTLDKGWVTETSVEDTKILPGDDIPTSGWRMGVARDREGCQIWTR